MSLFQHQGDGQRCDCCTGTGVKVQLLAGSAQAELVAAMLSLPCCLTQADRLYHQGRAGRGALQHPGAARVAGRSRVSGALGCYHHLEQSH